jgi:hypothetical protein
MSKNNFKDLEKEMEQRFALVQQNEIKHKVKASMDMVKVIGDFFDLYISKFIQMLVTGSSNNKIKK